MTKMFFVWEKSSLGWSPVVYYTDPPSSKSVNGSRPDIHPRYGVIPVETQFIGSDGQPMFGKLQKAYPIN